MRLKGLREGGAVICSPPTAAAAACVGAVGGYSVVQQISLLHSFSRRVERLCAFTARAVARHPVVQDVSCVLAYEGIVTGVLVHCQVHCVDNVCCCRAAHAHVVELRVVFSHISMHILRCARMLHVSLPHVGRPALSCHSTHMLRGFVFSDGRALL